MKITDVRKMPDGPLKRRLLKQLGHDVDEVSPNETAKRRKDEQPAINEAEELFWQQLKDAKLDAHFERQAEFIPGRRYKADFVDRTRRVLVEIDGGVFSGQAHGSIQGKVRDMERNNLSAYHHYLVFRFHTEQVTKTGEAIGMMKEFYARSNTHR